MDIKTILKTDFKTDIDYINQQFDKIKNGDYYEKTGIKQDAYLSTTVDNIQNKLNDVVNRIGKGERSERIEDLEDIFGVAKENK